MTLRRRTRHRLRAFLAGCFLAGGVAEGLPAQEKVNRRFAVAPDVAVRIHNLVGRTRIIGWDRDSIAVTGVIPAGAGSFYGGGSGGLAKLGVERRGDRLDGPGAMLEVRVPAGARVWVKGATADIEVEGLTGEADLSTGSGTVRVQGGLRQLTAETIDGALDVTGPVLLTRLRTGGGTVVARGLRESLAITSVSGAITVEGAAVLDGRLESVSGGITFSGSVDRKGRLEVQTHNAPAVLQLPGDIAAEFELTSLAGPVPLFMGARPKGKGPTYMRALGGGGAQVVVRSFKGEIRVEPR